MRTPADMPAARPGRRGINMRALVAAVAVASFILLTSVRGLAGFWTDLLWFDSLGYRSVFTGVLGAKLALAALATLAFFVLAWLNLFLADRLAPRFRPAGPEEELIERYQELVGHRTGIVRFVVSILLALVAGAGVASKWQEWLLFTNARDFGIADKQFDTDAGFYVFELPFLTSLVDWAFASVVVILLVTAAAHYLNGGIRVNVTGQRVGPQVKAHLSVLIGVLALLKAVGYWLDRFELTFSQRGPVDGASYTDVKAQLPALHLLLFISLLAFVLLIFNIWRRGWVLPVLAVGLWAFVSLVVGGIYPAVIQRFQVEPAESSKERPYIGRNIEATRAALGLDKVKERPFAADDTLTSAQLADNEATLRNIRLWDPVTLKTSYTKLQLPKGYYRIGDVDVDRYDVDGRTTQVMMSVRELNVEGIPQRSWENEHLTYTHGYGIVAAPSNAKDGQGQPELLVRDIPARSTEPLLELKQPGIYFGERSPGFVVVDTKRREIEYASDAGTEYTTYAGADGVNVGSTVRRAAFAFRFGDWNTFVTGNIRRESKILFKRDVRERVSTLAPFLSYDADPYPVVLDGKVQWVVDAYTTSSHYPYGQRADATGLTEGSGLAHGFNYARNSVKAVVDAYDGTTTLYVVDDTDPIIDAYRGAFPDLFADSTEVPAALRAHFRYPEDLFRVQTNMWGRYHIEDPDGFYTQNDAWDVAQEPDSRSDGASTTPSSSTVSTLVPAAIARQRRMDPYYLLMRLPDEEDEEFLLLRPFVPLSRDDNQRLLTAFMVAKSDPDHYGELEVFTMPRSGLPDGPAIAAARMQSDQTVAQYQTFLDQAGSDLEFGNMILTPIEQSLLYVRPVYVQSSNNPVPVLAKVIAYYDGRVVMEDTLQAGLTRLFGDAPATGEAPAAGTPTPTPATGGTPPNVADLLARASRSFAEAEDALKRGDLGEYQRKVREGAGLVSQAQGSSGGPASVRLDSTTTTSTTRPNRRTA